MEAEHPLDDREPHRGHVLRRGQRPVPVAVDRLEDRPAAPEMDEVLLQDVEMVALGMQRGDAVLGSLRPGVAVVVVAGDVRDLGLAEDPHQAARQRRLARGRVADDSEQDRPWHDRQPTPAPIRQQLKMTRDS